MSDFNWSTIAELEAENHRLRETIEYCLHKTEISRIWNGQGWTYHYPTLKDIHTKCEAAVKSAKEQG